MNWNGKLFCGPAAVQMGRITHLARPSVRLSVRPSVQFGLIKSKAYRRKKQNVCERSKGHEQPVC